MPLQPNFIERQLIGRGVVPWPLLDAFIPTFQSAAVISAAELGAFEALRDPLTLDELATRIGASRVGTESLLNVLIGLGYAEQHDDRFSLTAVARRTVPVNEMRIVAPFLREQLRATLDATRAIREAPPRGVANQELIQGGEIGLGFQTAMRWIASGNVSEVVQHVTLPATATRLLDVGGSHGLYTAALCRKYPRLRGTVLDWPIGIEAARRTMREQPDVADRIDFVAADFERDELPSGYDVAFLGNIVHGLSPEDNQTLFRKLARSTTSSGTVVILDQLAGSAGSAFSKSVASLIGFNLFLVTGGRAYRFEQLRQWLTDAGFPIVSATNLRRAPGLWVVTAQKR